MMYKNKGGETVLYRRREYIGQIILIIIRSQGEENEFLSEKIVVDSVYKTHQIRNDGQSRTNKIDKKQTSGFTHKKLLQQLRQSKLYV